MARRKGGLFLPLDVNFMDDPLIDAVGEQAAWLYLAMCLRCKALGVDGLLTRRQIEKLGVRGWETRLRKLTETPDPRDGEKLLVWAVDGDSYYITGWLRHNDLVEIVDERRARDAARKRSGAASNRNPSGIPSESARRTEQSREEQNTDSAPNGERSPVDECPHGYLAAHRDACPKCQRATVIPLSRAAGTGDPL